jgi:hypothetical protein
MPPFRQTLSAGEIDDLVEFLHSLKSINSGNADAMRAHWKHLSKKFTQIVEAMPEDKYGFRPTKRSSSFRELVISTIEDNFIDMGYVGGRSREESEKLAANYKTVTARTEILDALEDSYNYGDMILENLTDQNATDIAEAIPGERTTRARAVLQAFEDLMEHYGNLVIYLGLNGITSPDVSETVEDE